MNFDQDFFQVSKLSEDQKKRSSPEMEHFFPPNSGEDQKKNWIKVQTCAQMHTWVKLLEGMQMKIILKLLGGIKSNYWGRYIPPSSPGFGTMCPVIGMKQYLKTLVSICKQHICKQSAKFS